MLIIMVMFSLLGQSSASMMMSCDMMNMADMAMPDMQMSHDMSAADHNMSMMANDSATNMTADCCQEQCDCATTTCNPNAFTNSFTPLNAITANAESQHLAVALPQEQFLNYLFKPPIL
ncbi:MAG: hypothetical protein ACPG52_02810 [Cognaticolwellia sp.]